MQQPDGFNRSIANSKRRRRRVVRLAAMSAVLALSTGILSAIADDPPPCPTAHDLMMSMCCHPAYFKIFVVDETLCDNSGSPESPSCMGECEYLLIEGHNPVPYDGFCEATPNPEDYESVCWIPGLKKELIIAPVVGVDCILLSFYAPDAGFPPCACRLRLLDPDEHPDLELPTMYVCDCEGVACWDPPF